MHQVPLANSSFGTHSKAPSGICFPLLGEAYKKGDDIKCRMRFLIGLDKHISARLMLLQHKNDTPSGPYFNLPHGSPKFIGLHRVALLAIARIVSIVLEMSSVLNHPGTTGTARVISHDAIMIGSVVYDFNLGYYNTGGPTTGAIVPDSPSGPHLPERSPSRPIPKKEALDVVENRR